MEQTTTYLIPFVIAAVTAVAAIIGVIVAITKSGAERKTMTADYEAQKDVLQERLAQSEREKAGLESRISEREQMEEQLRESQEQAIKLQIEAQEKAMAAQKEQHEKDLENMSNAFKALSAENTATFKSQSAESISELLKPIQEKFKEFGDKVDESRRESVAQSAAMKENIESVMKHSKTVGDEARNLANALSGYSKVQGDFGEMLLTDVLKNAGLVEGIHFLTQKVMTDKPGHEIKSEEGKTLIPDVMVLYPDDTAVIIDSKVSLNAYSKFLTAETIEDRKKFAKAHIESVRKHVDELKSKDYASYLESNGKSKIKDNIMFIPVEGAFRLMQEEDPLLWQAAKDNNVLIVSQMTLVIVLNMIQMAWKQHDQEKNITEVYKAGEELMGELREWMENHAKIGAALTNALDAYKEATYKLKDSNQSVVKKIQKLEKLGLAPRKSKSKIKTGTRLTGPESVIPSALTPEEQTLPEETDSEETVQEDL